MKLPLLGVLLMGCGSTSDGPSYTRSGTPLGVTDGDSPGDAGDTPTDDTGGQDTGTTRR